MPTTTEEFINVINLTKPFVLFLGRQRRVVERPARFEHRREHLSCEVGEFGFTHISNLPVRESYSLFIDGKPFSVTYPTGKKRFSVKISKPSKPKNAPIEIHLVKKYTVLANAA